jgi:hypothetical protein
VLQPSLAVKGVMASLSRRQIFSGQKTSDNRSFCVKKRHPGEILGQDDLFSASLCQNSTIIRLSAYW